VPPTHGGAVLGTCLGPGPCEGTASKRRARKRPRREGFEDRLYRDAQAGRGGDQRGTRFQFYTNRRGNHTPALRLEGSMVEGVRSQSLRGTFCRLCQTGITPAKEGRRVCHLSPKRQGTPFPLRTPERKCRRMENRPEGRTVLPGNLLSAAESDLNIRTSRCYGARKQALRSNAQP